LGLDSKNKSKISIYLTIIIIGRGYYDRKKERQRDASLQNHMAAAYEELIRPHVPGPAPMFILAFLLVM
jgi:hypothetical protein